MGLRGLFYGEWKGGCKVNTTFTATFPSGPRTQTPSKRQALSQPRSDGTLSDERTVCWVCVKISKGGRIYTTNRTTPRLPPITRTGTSVTRTPATPSKLSLYKRIGAVLGLRTTDCQKKRPTLGLIKAKCSRQPEARYANESGCPDSSNMLGHVAWFFV